MAGSDPRLGYAARLMALTGLRRSAAFALKWSNIDFERDVIWSVATKGKRIVIPMLPECRELLLKLKANNPYRYHRRDHRVLPLGSTLQRWLEAAMKKASKKLGISINHIHALRHYFGSACLEVGIPAHEVASIIGHSDGGKTLLGTYAHVNAANIARRFASARLLEDDLPPTPFPLPPVNKPESTDRRKTRTQTAEEQLEEIFRAAS
jgi:integrase